MKYSKEFDYAIIYSNEILESYQIEKLNNLPISDIKNPINIDKNTKIGICNSEGDIFMIIEFKKDSKCFINPDSKASGFTTDSCQSFLLNETEIFQLGESIDMIENNWDFEGFDIKRIKEEYMLLELDHLIIEE